MRGFRRGPDSELEADRLEVLTDFRIVDDLAGLAQPAHHHAAKPVLVETQRGILLAAPISGS